MHTILIAEDEPGHGSMPRVTNAVTRLVRAFANLDDHEFEPRIVPELRSRLAMPR